MAMASLKSYCNLPNWTWPAGAASRITLDTTEPLQRAVRFYEKHGYVASRRTTDFFGMALHEYVKELKL